MNLPKEQMIDALAALRAVRDVTGEMPELEDEGGYVEEMLSTGDGFLIMYTTDVGVFRFLYEDGETCQVQADEYDKERDGSVEITDLVPEMMAQLYD